MALEFGNDSCTACEPSARIWHKGNDPNGRRPIAIIVVDVDLLQIQRHQLAQHRIPLVNIPKHSTHSLSFNECVVTSDKVVSARKEARSAHVEILKMEVQGEKRQERTVHPQSCTCKHIPFSNALSSLLHVLAFVFLIPQLTVFGRCAGLSLLVLYGIHGAHCE